jgi:hypothetical protein
MNFIISRCHEKGARLWIRRAESNISPAAEITHEIEQK